VISDDALWVNIEILCDGRDRSMQSSATQTYTPPDVVNSLSTANHVRFQAASPSNAVVGCLQSTFVNEMNKGTSY